MPSIVPFGKFFCRYFATAKFLRDFQGFRPQETLLLCSVLRLNPRVARSFRRGFSALIFALRGGASAIRRRVDQHAPGLSELVHEPVAKRLSHQREFGAVRQTRKVTALTPR